MLDVKVRATPTGHKVQQVATLGRDPIGRAVFRRFSAEYLPYPELQICVEKRSDRALLNRVIRGYDRVRRVFEAYGIWTCGECGIEVVLASRSGVGLETRWRRFRPSSEPIHLVVIRTATWKHNPTWASCHVFSHVAFHCCLGHAAGIPAWLVYGVPQFMASQMEQPDSDSVTDHYRASRCADRHTRIANKRLWDRSARPVRYRKRITSLCEAYHAGEIVRAVVRRVGLERLLTSTREVIGYRAGDPTQVTDTLLKDLRIERSEIDREARLHLTWGLSRPRIPDVTIMGRYEAATIRYDSNQDLAPVVVAKGRGRIASVLGRDSVEFGVATYRYPPLCSALIRSTQIGDEIPAHLYRPVAEILAYLYRLKKEASKSSPAGGRMVKTERRS